MDAEYRDHYPELFEKHWWWRARSQFIIAALARLNLTHDQTTILDIGCGNGLFFEHLSKFGSVEGVDVQEALQQGSKWQNRIHCGAFNDTFQPHKKYSLILMLDVLEHLPEPIAALRNVHRLLTDNGTFLATVPAFNAAWTNHDTLNQHIIRHTKQSMREALETAGLRVLEQHYFFHWAFLAKLLVRGYEAVLPHRPKVPRIPPRLLNESLYGLSIMEQKTMYKMPIPFGSSLIVLAKVATL